MSQVTKSSIKKGEAIDEIANDVSKEIESAATELVGDRKQEYYESQVELERVKNESLTEQISVFIPIIAIIGGFSYLAFRSYQKRKWREALLNKGFSLDEINQSENDKKLIIGSGPDELANYDKRKTMKYSIVFGSLGIAITDTEKAKLIAFLKTLTDRAFILNKQLAEQ